MINQEHDIKDYSDHVFISKAVTFDGSAGGGAVGTVAIFTVTGTVALRIFAVCSSDLASAGGGSVALGTANSTTGLVTTTTATDIDNNDIWTAAAPALGVKAIPGEFIVNENIILTVTVGDVTSGAMTFYCDWRPVSSNGTVV